MFNLFLIYFFFLEKIEFSNTENVYGSRGLSNWPSLKNIYFNHLFGAMDGMVVCMTMSYEVCVEITLCNLTVRNVK